MCKFFLRGFIPGIVVLLPTPDCVFSLSFRLFGLLNPAPSPFPVPVPVPAPASAPALKTLKTTLDRLIVFNRLTAANLRRSQLCVVRRKEKDQKFPPSAITHRGGALPLQHLAFFKTGKKYRAPVFLATSFNELTAYGFWYVCWLHGHLSGTMLHFPFATKR